VADAGLSARGSAGARRERPGRPFALVAALAAVAATGCAASPPTHPATAPAPAVTFSGDAARLPRYHSKRLGLSLPLPDGQAWRIDDHSRPELVATHPPTRSSVAVAILRTDAPVGRAGCEARARELGLVPAGDLRTVDEEIATTQETFDTRILVAVGGSGPGEPLAGHVLAFGGWLRKCYVFRFSTQVDALADEPALSARLAFARARILAGMTLDAPGAPGRVEGP
jgi:hypothetical protein